MGTGYSRHTVCTQTDRLSQQVFNHTEKYKFAGELPINFIIVDFYFGVIFFQIQFEHEPMSAVPFEGGASDTIRSFHQPAESRICVSNKE